MSKLPKEEKEARDNTLKNLCPKGIKEQLNSEKEATEDVMAFLQKKLDAIIESIEVFDK